jgi:hypothetical protein
MESPSNTPIRLELKEGYALFRASGQVTLEEGVEIVDSAIALARDRQIGKLVADVAGFSGFAPPNLAERYFFIRRWADTSRGLVSVVVITQPEMIDPEKFGVKVAANLGFKCEVFPTEAEAVAWIRSLR